MDYNINRLTKRLFVILEFNLLTFGNVSVCVKLLNILYLNIIVNKIVYAITSQLCYVKFGGYLSVVLCCIIFECNIVWYLSVEPSFNPYNVYLCVDGLAAKDTFNNRLAQLWPLYISPDIREATFIC